MSEDITISLPIYIKLGKSKKTTFSLNLNMYRNAHFHTLNQAKVRFEQIVATRICDLPPMNKVELTYNLFAGSKRQIDISNVCCIVDKFFCDTLVNQKKLIDDNMDVISNVIYKWGKVDSKNPRVEVTLSNIEFVNPPKEESMKISLTQDEIAELLGESINRHVTFHYNQVIDVAFHQTDAGISVNIYITKGPDNRDDPDTEESQDYEVRDIVEAGTGEPKRRRGRPPGSKNKVQAQAPYGREASRPTEEEVDDNIDEETDHEAREAAENIDPIEIEGVEVIEIQELVKSSTDATQPLQQPAQTTSLFNLPSVEQITESIVKESPELAEAAKQLAAAQLAASPGSQTSRIFPDIGTSAPTPTQEAPPATGQAPRSLFANLVKPVNSAPKE